MRRNPWLIAVLALALAAPPAAAQGKGKGNDKDKGPPAAAAQPPGQAKGQAKGQPPGQAKGKSAAQPEKGNAAARATTAKARNANAREQIKRMPSGMQALSRSNRSADRYIVGAAALGVAHGLAADAFGVRLVNDRVEVRNRAGDVLFDMDEDRARRLGVWNMTLLPGQARDNAPAFCRSGEGHPVWGREWCLQKGFGLGQVDDRRWSRGTVEDVVFGRRVEQERLDRGSLIDVIGDVVFGRLALHALALGFDQPLVGAWQTDPTGPRLLRIHAGDQPVAELVDMNGDDRVDVLYVSHRGY